MSRRTAVPEWKEKAAKLYKLGLSQEIISVRLGCGKETLRKYLREIGAIKQNLSKTKPEKDWREQLRALRGKQANENANHC